MAAEDAAHSPSEEFLRRVARAPAVEPEIVGRTLGRYEVLARLGSGGMGLVYRARDTKLRRDVALKVLPPTLIGDTARRKRLLREARLAAAVTHPSLVNVYDVGEEDGQVYVAMELVAGRTLRDLPMPMAAADVARIGHQVATAIAQAHDAGIVHRDLKPENVMVGDAGEVKVLDFGLARMQEDKLPPDRPPTESGISTRDGHIAGTPAYMSPEQAKGAEITDRSDVFSLGVLLYEMATGRRPFGGPTNVEIIIAIDRDEPPRPRRVRPSVPAPLSALIMRCLAKAPAERPSARDVAGALATAVEPVARANARTAVGVGLAAGAAVVAWLALGGTETAPSAAAASAPEPSARATVTMAASVLPASVTAAPATPPHATIEAAAEAVAPTRLRAAAGIVPAPRVASSSTTTVSPAASVTAPTRRGLAEKPPY